MRILHLPHNIASQIDTHVRMLRSAGVDARGLVWDSSPIHSFTGAVAHYAHVRSWRRPVKRILRFGAWYREVLAGLAWADVVHWRFGYRGQEALPWNTDLRYISMTRKPCVVDFCGTDIRIPEVASADNAAIRKAYGRDEMPLGSGDASFCTQELFARHGFHCLLRRHELIPYLDPALFPRFFMTRTPIILDEFLARFPDPSNPRPMVVHCPSRLGAKGTAIVLASVDKLRDLYDFDFRLVHGVPRAECLRVMQDADIVIDQILIGEYGNVSLESMAFGKPTVCYLKPSVMRNNPPDFPIINTDEDGLTDALAALLQDGRFRHETGRRSREYIETHHSSTVVVRDVIAIYESILAGRPPPFTAASFM